MATGIYHKFNVLKTRILSAHMVEWPNPGWQRPYTNREVAQKLGVPINKISDAMRHYQKQEHHKYFKRLKPLKSTTAYRYEITKYGIQYLFQYLIRMHEGFDLSLCSRKRTRTPQFEIARAEKQADWEQRHKVLADTGVFPPKERPTAQELLNVKPELLSYYIGITRHGAVEMSLTEANIY